MIKKKLTSENHLLLIHQEYHTHKKTMNGSGGFSFIGVCFTKAVVEVKMLSTTESS